MSESTPTDSPSSEERRSFVVRFLTGLIGFVVGIVPAIAGTLFFMDPLVRNKKSGDQGASDPDGVQKDEEGYINLKITVASLPENGSPQSVKIYDDKVDAWNKFKNVEVGTVWLRHDKETDSVLAFNTICPHLGCAIDYRQANNDFYCPCHTSTFDIGGGRLNKIPPRDMDPLKVKIKDDQIWLKYENFRAGTEERIPV